jgi:hypothetical protein
VDDGSTDATALICDELKSQYPEVKIIHHQRNRGYGAALKSGIMAANYDPIFFSDSDGQFDFHDLQQLICWSDDYDIIAGYRAKRQDPLYRRVNALGWNVLVRLVLGIKIRDIDCAFKLFRRSVFDHIQIRCVGAMVNTEILAQATQLGMRIREVKVTHLPRRHGTPSGANVHVIVKAFGELCRLWRKLRRVRPDQAGLYSDTNGAPIKAGFEPKSTSLGVLPPLFSRLEHAVVTLLAALALFLCHGDQRAQRLFQDLKPPAVTASAIMVAAPTALGVGLEPNESPPNQSRPEPARTVPRVAPLAPRTRVVAAPARKARATRSWPPLRIHLEKTVAYEWRQLNRARERVQLAFVRLGHKLRTQIIE